MHSKIFRGLTSVFAFLLVVMVFGTNIALSYSGSINSFFNLTTTHVESNSEDNEDTEYYKSSYGELSDENLELLLMDSYQQCVNEQEEGSVLLKNNDNALPLSEDERSVTLFGHASVDPVYKPTSGAAEASGDYLITYHDAMADAGFNINETLFSAYEGSGTSRVVGMDSPAYGHLDTDLGEEPIGFYTDSIRSSWENDYNDVAIVMFAREGGEDADLAVTDYEGISQLALHQDEKDLLEMIQSYKEQGVFKKVVVLLNSPWAMETDEINQYDVDAILWIGNTGLRGFEGVANILTGEANPSGKLTDTYAANSLSAPAITYANGNSLAYANADEIAEYCSDDAANVSYYTIYAEDIYVGYKYYETRYEDSILGRYNADSEAGSSTGTAWNYADEMSYPFGYGLSYTSFEQTLDSVERAEDEITVTVTVTNTGDVAGKSVVEVYAQKPYGEYEIQNYVEASAVQLVGFGKTQELDPGTSEQVVVSINPYLLASYDYTTAKGYILSEGTFYLSVGNDAHDALNNILAAKGSTGLYDQDGNEVEGDADKTYSWEQETLDTETYRYSAVTGEEVTNQFDEANINNLIEDAVTYLSRSDWENTYPTEAVSLTATEDMIVAINGYTYQKPEDAKSVSDYTQGEDSGLTFVAMKDVAYDDDETWDLFLNQLTIEELCSVLSTDMTGVDAVESIMFPAIQEGDGIDGVSSSFLYGDNRGATAFTGKCVLAATWNTELMENRGTLMGEEALYCNFANIWAGGGDIDRTPFSGRNFEYYSEDGTFTYLAATVELGAMQKTGLNAGIKHFAGNDQETNRESLSSFFNEQSWRENNLRAFEGVFCDAGILDTMQGFNRIGCTYMAQCEPLMTGILRNEWGYEGKVITDAVAGGVYKTHYAESLSAGTDFYCWDKISFTGEPMIASEVISSQIVDTDDGYLLSCVRRAAKHIFYSDAHTMAINGLSSDVTITTTTPWWEIALYVMDALMAIGFIVFGVFYLRNEYGRKKEEGVEENDEK